MPDFRDDVKLDTSQVEDLRGRRRVGRGGMAVGGGGIGIIVTLLIIFLGGNVTGSDGGLGELGNLAGESAGTPSANSVVEQECDTGADADEREDCRIVGYVNSIQAYWTEAFTGGGREYEPARTRFFTDSVDSGCGAASSAMGPFYCPADQYVYIDLGFFDELRSRFGAQGGPFAAGLRHGSRVRAPHPEPPRRPRRAAGPGRREPRRARRAPGGLPAGVWAANAVDTGFLTALTGPTSPTRSTPRPRSATTASRRRCRAASPRRAGRTAPRSSAAVVHDRLRVRQPGLVRHLQRRRLTVTRAPPFASLSKAASRSCSGGS